MAVQHREVTKVSTIWVEPILIPISSSSEDFSKSQELFLHDDLDCNDKTRDACGWSVRTENNIQLHWIGQGKKQGRGRGKQQPVAVSGGSSPEMPPPEQTGGGKRGKIGKALTGEPPMLQKEEAKLPFAMIIGPIPTVAVSMRERVHTLCSRQSLEERLP